MVRPNNVRGLSPAVEAIRGRRSQTLSASSTVERVRRTVVPRPSTDHSGASTKVPSYPVASPTFLRRIGSHSQPSIVSTSSPLLLPPPPAAPARPASAATLPSIPRMRYRHNIPSIIIGQLGGTTTVRAPTCRSKIQRLCPSRKWMLHAPPSTACWRHNTRATATISPRTQAGLLATVIRTPMI